MRTALCICAIVLGACANDPIGNTTDTDGGATSHDLSVAADQASPPETCDQVAAQANTVIADDVACSTDDDCMNVSTACGMPGECGAAVDAVGQNALDALSSQWKALGCMGACPPCAQPGPVGCVGGKCQFEPPRPWGAACTKNVQCQTGFCLTPAISPQFTGGYCSAPCDEQAKCPDNLRCTSDGTGKSYCLVPCTMNGDCRVADHYACCSGGGPFGGMGWCAPDQSGLCLAK